MLYPSKRIDCMIVRCECYSDCLMYSESSHRRIVCRSTEVSLIAPS